MNKLFANTVSALCYAIIDNIPLSKTDDFWHNHVVEFVLGQYRRMPDYLQWLFLILTLIFNLWGWWRGSPFHCQPSTIRYQQIQTWKNSPFSPCRDLIRFYENLVVLCWQSLVYNHHV